MISLLRKNYFNKLVATHLNCQQRVKKRFRVLSTLNYSTHIAENINYKDLRREYLAVAPDLFRDLIKYASKYQSKDANKFFEKALDYNVIRAARQYTGIVTMLAYKELADKAQFSSENLKLAQYLGWCVDMATCSTLIVDDIQDGGSIRHGMPCWYMLEDVGMIAINDSLMMFNGIYHILKENFSQKDYYVKLLEIFNEIIFITTFGQSTDLQVDKRDVTSFTMDTYTSISANKTSYITLCLPITLAMYLCGITDPDVYKQAEATTLELGQHCQVRNDFHDCFGDSEETGKIGTDIQENKCTWLAVVCMEKASEAQKEIMRECYGKSDPVKIARVKHLYEELGLPDIYAAYKDEALNKVLTSIQEDSGGISSRIYKMFVPFFSRKNREDFCGSAYM